MSEGTSLKLFSISTLLKQTNINYCASFFFQPFCQVSQVQILILGTWLSTKKVAISTYLLQTLLCTGCFWSILPFQSQPRVLSTLSCTSHNSNGQSFTFTQPFVHADAFCNWYALQQTPLARGKPHYDCAARTDSVDPLCPAGFTASAESAAWAFLALLIKNNSCHVLSLLSPFLGLRKVEPPILHTRLKMNRICCVRFSINTIHLLSFSSQWKVRKKHLRCHDSIGGCKFEALKWVQKLLFLHYLADRFRSLARLNLIKNQKYQSRNYCINY